MGLRKAAPDPVTSKTESIKIPSGVKRLWRRFSYSDDPTLSPRHKRAVLLMAAFVPIATLSFWNYAVFYLIYDPANLWPATLTCFVAGVLFLGLPSFVRRNVVVGCFAMLLIGGTIFAILCYFFGAGSGLNLGFFTGAALALMILGTRRLRVLAAVAGPALGLALILPFVFPEPALPGVTPDLLRFIYQSNVGAIISLTILALVLAVRQVEIAESALEVEHARSEALLDNLLPHEIAARLKVEPDRTIADNLPQVAILFADIVDFTPRSAKMAPEEIVKFLNRIFSAFDALAEKHGLEKIKTIGDAYMVAAGMPEPCADPVHKAAEMALDMLAATEGLPDDVQVRIGLHAGPAVAGVIGNKKLFYDVWGETVNTASRMESHAQPGRIQVTAAAKSELDGNYEFDRRGPVEIKGMGPVETWWLKGPLAPKTEETGQTLSASPS